MDNAMLDEVLDLVLAGNHSDDVLQALVLDEHWVPSVARAAALSLALSGPHHGTVGGHVSAPHQASVSPQDRESTTRIGGPFNPKRPPGKPSGPAPAATPQPTPAPTPKPARR